MRRQEIIDRERRWARPAAAASALVLVLFVIGLFVGQSVAPAEDATEAEGLEAFAADSSTILVASVLQALGIALLAAPLVFLFRAAQARSDAVRGALVGVVVAGPLFLGTSLILQWAAFDAVSADFVGAGGEQCPDSLSEAEQDDCVEDLVAENALFGIAQGLALAGTLGLVIGLVYTSLQAMRVGLLTRFFGTLGMALGVSLLFLGPLAVLVYALGLALLFMGWWPGGRPPAWESGEARPWPKPGEQTAEPRDEEPVEGTAEELFGDRAADSGEQGAGRDGGESDDGTGGGPRKRKRRG